jgi:flagellar hook-associated protein 3 FlgL
MRVTANSFTNDLVGQLGSLLSKQGRLQSEAATGQRIRGIGDDPAAMGRVLDLQSEIGAVAQYRQNIAVQREMGNATYGVIQGLKKISDRAGEIATLADGLRSPDEMSSYAAEITQLLRQAIQLANTEHRGAFLLGGTEIDQPPFSFTEAADGSVASVAYHGNESLSQTEVAEGVTLTAQAVGANAADAGPRGLIADARAGADLFNHLISLQNHLLANNAAAIAATDRGQLRQDEENLLFHVASNGGVQARLEAADAMAEVRSSSLERSVSSEADANLSETLVRLSQTQTAYQAALQSGASMMKLSLLDYLR